MTAVALPVELGVCVPFAGANSTKANAFGLKPNDGVNPSPTKLKRSDFNWWTNQPTNPSNNPAGKNDSIDFSDINLITDAAHANGYKLIGMCGYTPPWAAGGNGYDKNFPRDANNGYRDYANYVYLVCKWCENRHPGTLLAVEIWNEPNQTPFMSKPNVANYISMLQTAYTAQKDGTIQGRTDNGTRPVNTVQLITGGTGAAPIVGSQFRHLNWDQSVISAAPNSFDHIGIHAYSSDKPLGTNNGYDPGFNDIPGISAALHAAGRDDAQIICTEAGWQTPGVTTLQHAADFLGQTWAWWVARSGDRALGGINYNLGPYCLFECDDTDNTGTDQNGLQGMYTYGTGAGDGVAKLLTGTPVYLNKYLALAAGAVTDNPPTITINFPTDTATVSGAFDILINANDDITAAASLIVKVKVGSTILTGNATYFPAGVSQGYNFKYHVNTLDGTWPDGAYVLHATVNDGVNTVVTSAATNITVLNGTPGGLAVTSVAPDAGNAAGGTSVVVTGSGFTGVSGASSVRLVNGPVIVNAASYVVTNDTHLTLVTPAQPGGSGTPALNFGKYFAFGAGIPSTADIDGMIADGADGIRFSASWSSCDPGFSGGSYNGTGLYDNSLDTIIQYCNNAVTLNGKIGFDVILQIALGSVFGGVGAVGTPGSSPGMGFNHNANRDGSPGNTGPVNVPLLLSTFAINVGTRYQPGSVHGVIKALEVGNEPNHAKWDQGSWTIGNVTTPCSGVADTAKGVAYFEYLARCYPPLHALGVTIIPGGLGGVTDAIGDQPADQFLSNLLTASFVVGPTTYHGTDGLWDHFNFHPYSHPASWTQDAAAWNPATQRGGRGYALLLFKVVPILTSAGLISKGIWVTEVGNPTNDPDIQTASDNMTDIMNVWNTQSWGGGGGNPLCWFNYQDKVVDPKNRPYGVIDANGVKKQPFWQTFHDLSVTPGTSQVPTTFDIEITNAGTTTPPHSADQFTYGTVAGGPVVSSISPTHGAAGGATALTVVGTDFTGTTGVKIGTTSCTSVVVVDDSHITCVSPAGTASTTAHLRVTNPTATSPAVPNDQFTYDAASGGGAPTVTSLSPSTGTAAGGTRVDITGTNLTPVTNVAFGGVASPSVVPISSTHLVAIAPPGSGVVDVRVTTPVQQSVPVAGDHYTYTSSPGIPTVTSASPASGPANGGTKVTLTGTNFVNVAGVKVGGVAALNVTVLSATSLTFITPVKPKGSYDIVVTNATGSSVTPSAVQFQFGNAAPTADIFSILLADNTTLVNPPSGKIGGTVTFFMVASDDNDTTLTVKLYDGAKVIGTGTRWQFGYFVGVNTRTLTSGDHAFSVQAGPDSGGLVGPMSPVYHMTVSNPAPPGVPPPKG